MNYWLLKSEPFKYSFDKLMAEGRTFWDGVRNYQARIYLNSMAVGDLALYYHSNEEKAVVGIAEIVSTSYPDPTDDTGKWVVVDVAPVKKLDFPVPLQVLREDPVLSTLNIFRQMRLSIVSVTPEQFDRAVLLGSNPS